MSCLCTLEINPLSVANLANIFCHSEHGLFILFMVSFAVQKLSSLIRSHWIIFVFIFITLGTGSKKILATKRNETGSSVETRMDLQTIIERELSQKEKNKYRILAHICGI